MKTVSLALFLLIPALLTAQDSTKQRTEVSFSASFQNVSSENSSSSTSVLLATRIGINVYKGLAIEPEAAVVLGGGSSAYTLNGNVVFNLSPGKSGVPFLLAGYGISNSVPVMNIPMYSPGFSIGVLNLGAGLKVFLADNVAIRGEYRFQRFNGEQQSTYGGFYSYTRTVNIRIHSFWVGILIAL